MNQKYKTHHYPRQIGKKYNFDLNSLIAEGLTRTQQKKRLKNFWDKHWRFNYTIDYWYRSITDTTITSNNDLVKVKACVKKLYLDERIGFDRCEQLTKMLSTHDDADKLFALQIISTIRPNIFKKPKN